MMFIIFQSLKQSLKHRTTSRENVAIITSGGTCKVFHPRKGLIR